MFAFHRFKARPPGLQIEELGKDGVSLDLAYSLCHTEAVLFAYNDFYVELVVVPHTDEILRLACFKSLRRLTLYLQQVDVREITNTLRCNL